MPDTAISSVVRLSASAARRISKIVAGQAAGTMLRVEVIGGGCSGFSYRFGFADKVNADDLVDGLDAQLQTAALGFSSGDAGYLADADLDIDVTTGVRFHPLEAALVGAPVQPGEVAPVAVQHIVRSFDPCMVCTVH